MATVSFSALTDGGTTAAISSGGTQDTAAIAAGASGRVFGMFISAQGSAGLLDPSSLSGHGTWTKRASQTWDPSGGSNLGAFSFWTTDDPSTSPAVITITAGSDYTSLLWSVIEVSNQHADNDGLVLSNVEVNVADLSTDDSVSITTFGAAASTESRFLLGACQDDNDGITWTAEVLTELTDENIGTPAQSLSVARSNASTFASTPTASWTNNRGAIIGVEFQAAPAAGGHDHSKFGYPNIMKLRGKIR